MNKWVLRTSAGDKNSKKDVPLLLQGANMPTDWDSVSLYQSGSRWGKKKAIHFMYSKYIHLCGCKVDIQLPPGGAHLCLRKLLLAFPEAEDSQETETTE